METSGPQRPVMVNGIVSGKGAGKGAPERVDSKYHLLDAAETQNEAAAAAARAALPSPPEEEPDVVWSVERARTSRIGVALIRPSRSCCSPICFVLFAASCLQLRVR